MVLTLNPFIAIQIAAILQTGLVAILVLQLESFQPQKHSIQLLYSFLKKFVKGVYGIISILLIDISISWFLGVWNYLDWRFQMPSAILSFIIGVEYFIYAFFRKGVHIDIIFSILLIFTFTLSIHWLFSTEDVMGPIIEEQLPIIIITFIGIYAYISFMIIFILEKRKERQNINKILEIWNISDKVDRVFSKKLNIIIWILATLQAILTFSGYSILSF